jgi:hypothetical protein
LDVFALVVTCRFAAVPFVVRVYGGQGVVD